MKVALLQTPVSFDRQRNIDGALESLRWAAENGADVAVLPEMFTCPYANKYFPVYAEEGVGPTRASLSAAARRVQRPGVSVTVGSANSSGSGGGSEGGSAPPSEAVPVCGSIHQLSLRALSF